MTFKTLFTALILATSFTGLAHAGSLENLERERALLIETFLNSGMEAAERQEKIAAAKPGLIDLERMVLRDESLTGRNTPVVRKAYANYDLTFLMHASLEADRGPFDIWMNQVGLTSAALGSARIGRKY